MKKVLLGMAGALMLAGCGGGGSDTAAPPAATAPATFNIDGAWAKALTEGVSFPGLRGSDNQGRSYAGSLSFTPAADGAFQGKTTRRATQSMTLGLVNGPSTTVTSSLFFTVNPLKFVGNITNGVSRAVTHTADLPTAALVGQSGPFAQTTTSTMTWSLEADTATTAYACLSMVETSPPATEKDCYLIDTAGRFLGTKVVGTVSGITFTLQ